MPVSQKSAFNQGPAIVGGEYANYDIESFGKELVDKSQLADSESVQIMLENSVNCN